MFLAAVMLASLAAALVFNGVMPPFYKRQFEAAAFGPAQFDYRLAAFDELPGWLQDDLEPAFSAFQKSCEVLATRAADAPANPSEHLGDRAKQVSLGGRVDDWREACGRARVMSEQSFAGANAKRASLREFFEFHFRPVQILDYREPLSDGPARRSPPVTDMTGVFTGYFEPVYRASRRPTAAFPAPVYSRPNDLIDIDLGAFREDFSGERLAGRLDGGRLVPYPDHRQINDGALFGKASPLAWLAPTDLFFLQIQGSGQLFFEATDGQESDTVRVGYAGQNGHAYLAIGRVMVERGIMPLAEVSMQSIRNWLDSADPAAAKAMREENASYVFFRELGLAQAGLGPEGAQGVPLTPGRSLAVDRRYHTLGAPVWVDIEPVGVSRKRIQRLMIAQDTGGAIRGPVRGDVFWGAGEVAGAVAGAMNVRGRMFVLVPRTVAAQIAAGQRS